MTGLSSSAKPAEFDREWLKSAAGSVRHPLTRALLVRPLGWRWSLGWSTSRRPGGGLSVVRVYVGGR